MKTFIVSFQYVSAGKHPEHYCTGHGSHPTKPASEVPDQDWTQVVVRHTNPHDATAQISGLQRLRVDGEYIRAVNTTTSTHVDHDDEEQPEPSQRVDHREHASYQ
jgi:hypothetical protein